MAEHSKPLLVTAPYREISRDTINGFLISAIKDARKAGVDQRDHGFRVLTVGMTEGETVRLDLDNGDMLFIDFEHLVPRHEPK